MTSVNNNNVNNVSETDLSLHVEKLTVEIAELQVRADELGSLIRSGQVPTQSTRRILERVLKNKIKKSMTLSSILTNG